MRTVPGTRHPPAHLCCSYCTRYSAPTCASVLLVLYPVLGTHLRICVARAVKRERAILTHVRGLGL